MKHTASYTRVIPRDFFNEAKLLKCMGQLALKILDSQLPEGIKIEIEETGEPFEVNLTDDGRLFISNYPTTINDIYVSLSTTYNSKDTYPLICYHDDIEYNVFDTHGNFTEEFIQFATNIE
jgi:hypothetical protein